ncbi:hypothetical protein E1B28_000935 [Marasmius oreades]|uniref:Integral membrane protein n=1 Tax=Marasmius oreades TaxID=181124 RepID=A0A9P8AF52_9AGAR|nr:uncharacterized protein E1B28_000935 [Marasmius oreades]KAG7099060.1 hypothetical protein E1B28_000935 [Marasmius oreades]
MSQVTKGTHPLLVKYLEQLAAHPLRTKAFTTAFISFLQEVVASHIAGAPVKKPSRNAPILQHLLARARIDTRAVKLAIYGFLVSAPLSHVLVGSLQKFFAGKVGVQAKMAQIFVHNLLISPIQALAYLTSMAIINGARTKEGIARTIKTGFWPVVRTTWIVSPLSMVIAQKYIPLPLWVLYFNLIQFLVGTYFNVRVKKFKRKDIRD